MTQEEIIQFNRLCADFLGWEFDGVEFCAPEGFKVIIPFGWKEKRTGALHCFETTLFKPVGLKFHSEWNWIMEVVEAIEKTDITELSNSAPIVSVRLVGCDIKFYNNERLPILTNAATKKEAVVKAINQFLTWYNTQPK